MKMKKKKRKNKRKRRKGPPPQKHIGKPTISLCMIVKNEERDLPRCLESAKDLVDEIIVVDTGSMDQTREVALGFGARLYDYEWCDDFAAARNYCIGQATKQWVLCLDADEELEVAQHGAIKRKLTQRGFDGLSLLVESKTAGTAGSSVHYVVRLFRNSKGIRFRGPIHESLDSHGLIYQFSNFRIYHYGYILDKRGRNKKIEREENILLDLTRKDPTTLEWFMYLFRNYLNQSRYRDVLNIYDENREHIDCRKDHLFFPVVQYLVAVCYFNLEEMSQVRDRLSELLSIYPESLDFNFLAGLFCSRIGDIDGSMRGFEAYLALSEKIDKDPSLRFGQQLIFNEGNQRIAKNFVAKIHTDNKDYGRALRILDELLGEDQKNLPVLMNIIQVYRAKEDSEGIRKSCERLLEVDPDNATVQGYLQESHQAGEPTIKGRKDLVDKPLVELVSIITKAHLNGAGVDQKNNSHLCYLGMLARLARGNVLQAYCRDAGLAVALAAHDVTYHGLFHPGAEADDIVQYCGRCFISNCLFSNVSLHVLDSLGGAFATIFVFDEDLQETDFGVQQLELLAGAVEPGGKIIFGLTPRSLSQFPQKLNDIASFFRGAGGFQQERIVFRSSFREILVYQREANDSTGTGSLQEVFDRRPVLPTLDRSALVSVVIPTYNRAASLSQSINSALDQTYGNIEVLVVDDGSTDSTREVAEGFGDRITYLRQEHGGCSTAVNRGLQQCRGEYIWILNDDDVALPGKVELQVRFFQAEPQFSMTHTDGYFTNTHDGDLGFFWMASHFLPNEMLRAQMRGNTFLSPSVIFKRKCMDEVGLWDRHISRGQDYDYWFRIVEKGRTGALNIPTVVASAAAIPGGNVGISPGSTRSREEYRSGERGVFEKLAKRVLPEDLHSIKSTENTAVANFSYGVEYGSRGLYRLAAKYFSSVEQLLRHRNFAPEHRLFEDAITFINYLKSAPDNLEIIEQFKAACRHLNLFFINPEAITAYQMAKIHLPGLGEQQPNVAEAIQQLKKVLEMDPDFPNVLQDLAACYLDAGRLDSAMEIYTKLSVLRPNFPLPCINMALISIELGSNDKARDHLHAAMKFVNLELHEVQQLVDIHLHLGTAREVIDEPLMAIDELKERYPQMASALDLKKSELYARFNLMDESFQLLDCLYKSGYTDQKLLNNLATIHQLRGELDAAADVFKEGYNKFPGNETLFRNYLSLLMERGEHQQAHTLIDHSLFVEQPDMRYLQAVNLVELGSGEKARTILGDLVAKHSGFDGARELLEKLG